MKATAYYTHVQDYVDARRCDFGQCSPENVTATNSFVLLQYANQTARLYGLDLSARLLLGEPSSWGSLTGSLRSATSGATTSPRATASTTSCR